MAHGVTRVVRAAGGLVWRPGPEVLLVHRQRYDDWSLPKGKLNTGEHLLTAAVREVAEESGVRAAPQVRLPSVRYLTGAPGVEKAVDYWSMRCLHDGGHDPTDEVDEVRWLDPAAARERLTYAHDRGVLAAFTELPPVTGVVVLLRHASAGERGEWQGDDSSRPLDAQGHRDAAASAEVLAVFAPERIRTATPLRCAQSVEPLGRLTGIAVEEDDRLDEDAEPAITADAIRALAKAHRASVVCSQGGLIPALVGVLHGTGGRDFRAAKATAWVLSFADDRLVAADRLDPRPAGPQWT
jgi:8-oxo-(d)GTP phosphatase